MSPLDASAPAAPSPIAGEQDHDAVLPSGPLKNVLLAALLLAMVAEGSPRLCPPHRWFARQVQWALNPLAIYQTRWQLFAPAPVDANAWVTAQIRFSDGEVLSVRTPDWRSMTVWERFRYSRHKKYVFHLQRQLTKECVDPLWPAYARFLARTVPRKPGQEVARVELTCHSYVIDEPEIEWIPFGGRSSKIASTGFFTEDYP
jgi:hypothetical protein